MKRAFFEWGAIATSTLAVVCFVYWIVSRTTAAADFELFLPLGHMKATPVWASGGSITVGYMEEVERVAKSRIVNPPLTSTSRRTLPGFLYQSIHWGGQLHWSLRLSILIPTFLMTLAAVFFFRGYLQIRCRALQRMQSNLANQRK